MKKFNVSGMSCAACQAHVEKAVRAVPGVKEVQVSLLTNSMEVEGGKEAAIVQAVEKAGYHASTGEAKNLVSTSEREGKKRLLYSCILLVVLMYITMGAMMWGWPLPSFLYQNPIGIGITEMLLALVVLFINREFFVSGIRSCWKGMPNMDTLVALGSGISFLWSLVILYQMTIASVQGMDVESLMHMCHTRLYFESSAMIPALITVGKTLEAHAKEKTTDSLKHLLEHQPKQAWLCKGCKEVSIDADALEKDMIFVVHAGEMVPADGKILEGNGSFDEAALTGESVPVDRTVGEMVHAATINQTGYVKVRTVHAGKETSFAQVISLVEEASSSKAPVSRMADKVAAVFVPIVLGIAAIVFCGQYFCGKDAAFAMERAVTVLVISCPCALGLATPVAVMVGNGVGARHNILFKSGTALENMGKVQIVAFDKTGTLTEGKLEVRKIIPYAKKEEEILQYAYSIEKRSTHPLAHAIVEKAEQEHVLELSSSSFEMEVGSGVSAIIAGKTIYGGSLHSFQNRGIVSAEIQKQVENYASLGLTSVLIGDQDTVYGTILLADTVREDAVEALQQLKNMGIETLMLTGDSLPTAKAVAQQAGVATVMAGLLPAEKDAIITHLKTRGIVAMVGDGINDAPSLVNSDIGVAIGTGTDVAIDSADVVLMHSSLLDVAAAIRLSRRVMSNIKENLFWAFAYNMILIPIAAGLFSAITISPMLGAAAMSLSSFTVCMNALRLNRVDCYDATKDHKIRKTWKPETVSCSCCAPVTEPRKEKKMKVTVYIDGMMCSHCEASVKKGLMTLDGVKEVEVSHEKGTAVVTTDIPLKEEEVRKIIEDKDFTFVAMK